MGIPPKQKKKDYALSNKNKILEYIYLSRRIPTKSKKKS